MESQGWGFQSLFCVRILRFTPGSAEAEAVGFFIFLVFPLRCLRPEGRDSVVSSLRVIDLPTPFSMAARRFSVPANPAPNGAVLNSETGAVPSSGSLQVHKTGANTSLVSGPVPYPVGHTY